MNKTKVLETMARGMIRGAFSEFTDATITKYLTDPNVRGSADRSASDALQALKEGG